MEKEIIMLINNAVRGIAAPHVVKVEPQAGQTLPPTMVLRPSKPTKSDK